jgi:hypothetical protein
MTQKQAWLSSQKPAFQSWLSYLLALWPQSNSLVFSEPQFPQIMRWLVKTGLTDMTEPYKLECTVKMSCYTMLAREGSIAIISVSSSVAGWSWKVPRRSKDLPKAPQLGETEKGAALSLSLQGSAFAHEPVSDLSPPRVPSMAGPQNGMLLSP